MIGKEASEQKVVSTGEVEEILKEREKDGEPTYEQQIALEHAKKVMQQKGKEAKAKKALEELGVLSPSSVMQLSSLMPQNASLVKQILAHERKSFDEETIKKILEITKEKG